MNRITITFDEENLRRARARAANLDLTLSRYANQILSEHLGELELTVGLAGRRLTLREQIYRRDRRDPGHQGSERPRRTT